MIRKDLKTKSGSYVFKQPDRDYITEEEAGYRYAQRRNKEKAAEDAKEKTKKKSEANR